MWRGLPHRQTHQHVRRLLPIRVDRRRRRVDRSAAPNDSDDGATFRVFDDGLGFRYELPDQPAITNYEISHTTLYKVHQRVAKTFKLGRAFLLLGQKRQSVGKVDVRILRIAAQIGQHLIHELALTLRQRSLLGLCSKCRLRRQQ